MKGYSMMHTLPIQKRKQSLCLSKELPSALRQSVDIQQNNYSTSIVSAQRQPLRHDFYSERSTSYACIVPIPQPHAHTSTSPHTKWSGQASKRKGQYQEKEQERKVTYRHPKTQLHVKSVIRKQDTWCEYGKYSARRTELLAQTNKQILPKIAQNGCK